MYYVRKYYNSQYRYAPKSVVCSSQAASNLHASWVFSGYESSGINKCIGKKLDCHRYPAYKS